MRNNFWKVDDEKAMKRRKKNLPFSLLFSTGLEAGMTSTGFLIAIGLLACILGAEIAGICILIGKMLRAREKKYGRTEGDDDRIAEETSEESNHRQYAIGSVVLLGAVSQGNYVTLAAIAIATAVAAVVFVALLAIFRLCGYDFVSGAQYREARARRHRNNVPHADAPAPVALDDESQYVQRNEADTEQVAESEKEPAPAVSADESEEQLQYAYTELAPEAEKAMQADENPADETAATTAADAVVSTPAQTTVMPAASDPVFADGTHPYKVVEKVVTETYKEVYKETPPAPAAPATSNNPAADAVMEKLADFLDYELQKRKESEKGTADDADEAQKRASVEAFAESDMPLDEEDMDDDDENEEEEDETEGEKSEEDEDRDDEENDTDGDRFTGNERIIGFDEKTGCYIVAHYRKSFEAKLIQARPNIKKYYSELKNALLSYKGSKSRISWTADSFHNGRTPIAKINTKTRILELYLALDPASLDGTVYRGKDVSSKKKYADTPFQYKLRTPRKFKWAMELVQRVCEEHGLSPIDIEHVDYEQQYPFDTTENLVERKLIKEYIRQEKPATSFELAPDHVPAVPDEDASVIPANANFSWEFDNEMMPEKEPEPAEEVPEEEPQAEPAAEPVSEPEAEPAPISEPTVSAEPQPSVMRETVKVTEMRYTERYYASKEPSYEHVVTTTEPIEVSAVSCDTERSEDGTASVAQTQEEEASPNLREAQAEESVESAEAAAEAGDEEPIDIWEEAAPSATDETTTDESVTDETEETEETDAAELAEEEAEPEELFFEPTVDRASEAYVDSEPESDPLADTFGDAQSLPEESEESEESEETETVAYDGADADDYETAEAAEAPWQAASVAVSADAEDLDETDAKSENDEWREYRAASVSEPEPVYEPEPVRKRIVNPSVAVVDICDVEEHFPQDAVIKLDTLKAKGLILPTATNLKICASGPIFKSFTVEANNFTMDAIKVISNANGDAVMVR